MTVDPGIPIDCSQCGSTGWSVSGAYSTVIDPARWRCPPCKDGRSRDLLEPAVARADEYDPDTAQVPF